MGVRSISQTLVAGRFRRWGKGRMIAPQGLGVALDLR